MDFEEWYHRKIFIQLMNVSCYTYIFCLVVWILNVYSWGRHDVAMYWLYGGIITLGVWIGNFIISKFLTRRKIKKWKEHIQQLEVM